MAVLCVARGRSVLLIIVSARHRKFYLRIPPRSASRETLAASFDDRAKRTGLLKTDKSKRQLKI